MVTQQGRVNKIKDDEMGGACGTYGGDKDVDSGMVGKPKGKSHVEDQGVHGGMLIKERHGHWVYLCADRSEWLAVVNAVMNLWYVTPLHLVCVY